MWQIEYQGARWVRADFHLHSPGAHSFSFPAGLSNRYFDELSRRYVEQLKSQHIEIAAITGYQQIRTNWFVRIRNKAKEIGIYVYPGVELSFGGGTAGKHGLHVLAIFPYDADPEAINRAIDKILDDDSTEPLVSSDGIHRDLKPKTSIQECLSRFHQEQNCIFIFAHPNDGNGLFKTYKPGDASEVLKEIFPEAIEAFKNEERQRLQNTGRIMQGFLQKIARVETSDNHTIEEIGSKLHNGRNLPKAGGF